MSCRYYWWNNHYACRKSGKDVNEDIYYKYCRNYDYGDCPIYKQQNPSDSRCYITTACIRAKNLPDNCHELTVLRTFRDTYLLASEEGKAAVSHYYEIAPHVVAAIEKKANAEEIFVDLYEKLVSPCVALISDGKHEAAFQLYKNTALELERSLQ